MKPFVSRLKAVVLVADGQLTQQLEDVIELRARALKIVLLRLSETVGLGQALNAGLNVADSDFVLRMDADDLCRSDRLSVLLRGLSEEPQLDVIGSYIAEFNVDPAHPHAVRRVPLAHENIKQRMRVRCAMNHVSCLMRRQALIDAGGYSGGAGFAEDWWLWARLLSRGARFGNVDRVLVDVRVGNGFIDRRRGWAMLRQDLRLLFMMRGIRFVSWSQITFLIMVKIMQRLLPAIVLKKAYAHLRSR
jgi:glycosyltransferase involved in cell wall biosynthesis